ncbi:hypothetical protein C4K18_3001 [Pseudomonas chlororaphis subsp. aurantiaca]|nr:hypothetical protein C4K18_3001 [Pseudomonas chlororaphis subsp. aurantiaca]
MLRLENNVPAGVRVPTVNTTIWACAECLKAKPFFFSDEVPDEILKVRR